MNFLNPKRIFKALSYSCDGLKSAFLKEAAFQQELIACAVLIPIALMTSASILGKTLCIGSLILVLVVEILNTALETLVDMVSPDQHPMAKYAKDLGSAAVLMTIVLGGLIWIGVLCETYL